MRLRLSATCDLGTSRDSNEDMVLVGQTFVRDGAISGAIDLQIDSPPFAVAVADGMGGASAGEVASQMVLEELHKGLTAIPLGLSDEELKSILESLCTAIHDRLVREGQADVNRRGMGSTLVALIGYGGRLLYVSAGDSRLYRFRDGILRQLTKDHSLRNLTALIDAPGNLIFNSLGGGCDFFVDFGLASGVLLEGDVFLLCSDGLTEALSDTDIEAILGTSERDTDLLATALNNNAEDNVSYVLVEVTDILEA